MSERLLQRRRLLRSAVAAALLSVGVVAAEHFSHEATGALHGELAHVVRDALLGMPLAFLALLLAARLALRGAPDRSAVRQLFVQAAATSVLFGAFLVPGALVHDRIDAALAVPSSGHVESDGRSTASVAPLSQLPHALQHGSRVMWAGLPFAAIAVLMSRAVGGAAAVRPT